MSLGESVVCIVYNLPWDGGGEGSRAAVFFFPPEKCHIISIFGSDDTALYPLKEG